jgi:hypothetical protein
MSIVGQTAQIDTSVTEALGEYLAFGTKPNKFAMALLRGDRGTAYATLDTLPSEDHEILGSHGVEDVVATMMEVVESAIPVFARGDDIDRWMRHKGLSGAPESIRFMAQLGIENQTIWKYVAKHHPDLITGTNQARERA